MKNDNVKRNIILTFFICIELILMLTPLGYIPFGVIRATTIHIPVIIGAILLGKREGIILGLVFGLTSLIMNTINPTITSFVFSPFISVGGEQGNFFSLLIVLIPRILLGFSAYELYHQLEKRKVNDKLNLVITASFSTFLHTFLVLGGIYLFFAGAYAGARGIAVSGLFNVLVGIVATNGILEMLLAAFVTLIVVRTIKPIVTKGS